MRKRAAIVLGLSLVLLTMTATGVAAALPAPGAIGGLALTPNPAPGWASGAPGFSWNAMTAIAGYSYTLDHSPSYVPGTTVLLSALSFSNSSVAASTYPWEVATGDLNGDGNLDLAVANQGSNSVSVLRGNGDGTFQAKQDYATGTGPRSLSLGNFDGDSNLDLAVANWDSKTISVRLGNGDGTFQAKQDYATGTNPHAIRTGDFNKDGKTDLVEANFGDNTVSVFLGNGDGTFQAKIDAATGVHADAVAVGNFNADANPDLAVANYGVDNVTPTTVSVLLGNGDGTFQTKVDYGVNLRAHSVAVGYLNGDSNLDLAVVNYESQNVSVLLGNGDGTFQTKVDYAVGGLPAAVAMTDINGDGILDLVTDNQNVGSIAVLPGVGDGAFRPREFFLVGASPRFFAVGDFNKDGMNDLALPHDTGTTVEIVTNTMKTVSPTVAFSGKAEGVWYFHVRAVDVTGQGGPASTITFQIDATAPVTTDNAPAGWQKGAVTVTLTPTDAGSGMTGGSAGTWYSLNGGTSWTAGTSVPLTTDGVHTITYYSKDAVGNMEVAHSATVSIDTRAPVTTDNAPSGWVSHTVTVTLKPTDAVSGMSGGLAGTWYSLNGGTSWTAGTSASLTTDGVHTITYYSKDAAGNKETAHAVTVRVDRHGPSTAALAAVKVKRGRVAVLSFRVTDVTPNATVTIKIFKRSVLKKTLTLGTKTTGVRVNVKWRCRLARGTYRWVVYATDQAGNRQVKAGANKLIVK